MITFEDKYGANMRGQTFIGDLKIKHQKIDTLIGSPKKVKGNFDVSFNQLTNLNHCPKDVTGAFVCTDNMLLTLKDGPERITLTFDVKNNLLKTLEGGPTTVGARYIVSNNKLESLKGAPEECKSFYCDNNPTLTTLKYAPKKVNGIFDCTSNPNLKNPKKQIIQYGIIAVDYFTDEGDFVYEDIKQEIETMKKRVTRPSMRTLLGLNDESI